MNLNQQTATFSLWLGRIIGTFMRLRFGTTLAVIGAALVSRITNLLAFFLPLKVILLAGSEGIPRYFPFISPEHKFEWILGLTLGALLCYVLTLALDALSNRLASVGSTAVMQQANEMAIVNNQDTTAQGYYTGLCNICANLLFATVCFAVCLALNPQLLLILGVLIGCQFLLTGWALGTRDAIAPNAFTTYLQRDLGSYLKILSSVNFLTGFVIILVPYLLGTGGNILVSILTILVLRQGMSALASVFNDAARFARMTTKVNALVFRDSQMEKEASRDDRSLRLLFHKDVRQSRVADELGRVTSITGPVRTIWTDSTISGANTITIHADRSEDGTTRHFQLQVFPQRLAHKLENEAFLFRHVARERLKAPPVLARFTEGQFVCQICAYGQGTPVSKNDWKHARLVLLQDAWACRPPPALVSAYTASHLLLHRLLGDALIEQLSVAVDTDKEARSIREFMERLPSIRSYLESLPLFVFNPDLKHGNVTLDGVADPLAMTWMNWTLEPLGAGMPWRLDEAQLTTLLEGARQKRDDIPTDLNPTTLMLCDDCWNLERLISRGNYKAALTTIARIMEGLKPDVDVQHISQLEV